jgi:hypothetical protein
MTALRRRNILAKLLKLTRRSRESRSTDGGPGCTCASCVQAWDRHHPPVSGRDGRRLRPGLY